ncbi:restriction endonuclease subunit S [Microbacterium dextranolyticum]|uniref:Type I restriction modification DNA specificity domain-containing protein n=1 Tax=Microbacterium dextranolyticum TaxID=36806 RepID=A0A9W6M528_9MICO|nr:restriction endonuclease subunit S [Microbacterium dextranolyticum]MBM7462162.1 type I restriction enzyme S subunit [Microbacterium dextranolyticum]GLJ94411.1 hypothetical protein GCM10017591_04720 [Microbacterium dextranolyticum]
MTRELRDSGVGWLGDTPAAWSVVPARALFGERKQKSSAIDVHLTPSQKYGVLPQAEYMEITGNKVVLNLSGADNMRHVEAGDYVSHLRSFQGGLEFAGIPGKVSAAYTVLKPKVALEPRFFKYLFKSDLYVQALQTTTDQLRDGQSIRYGQFTLIPLPYPELDEQRAIADYLDRETAQIDSFIAKNEELITLLTERRASVIGGAVTRGISEGVELSAKGPDWIGAVPAAWSVQPIKSAYSVVVGKMLNESKSEGDPVPYVRAANIQPEGLDLSDVKEMKATAADRRALTLQSGDVVFVEGGGGYGRSDYLAQDLPGWVFQNHVIRLRSRPGHDGRFLNYWLQHVRRLGHYEALSAFATIPNVSGDKLGRIEMPVPPLSEQREIVKHIEEASSRIDAAVAVAQGSVELARERRAALISAAVTGKIDVGVSV